MSHCAQMFYFWKHASPSIKKTNTIQKMQEISLYNTRHCAWIEILSTFNCKYTKLALIHWFDSLCSKDPVTFGLGLQESQCLKMYKNVQILKMNYSAEKKETYLKHFKTDSTFVC